MRVVGARPTHTQTHTHTGRFAEQPACFPTGQAQDPGWWPRKDIAPARREVRGGARRRIKTTPLEAVVSIQSNAERHLAEWIAQWEGILQGETRLPFPGVPSPARWGRHMQPRSGPPLPTASASPQSETSARLQLGQQLSLRLRVTTAEMLVQRSHCRSMSNSDSHGLRETPL